MTKDLTQGSPVRLILGFAVPLLAGMLYMIFKPYKEATRRVSGKI